MGTFVRPSEVEKYKNAAIMCACNSFRKASRAVTQLFDQMLEPSGLRSTQLVILLEIVAAQTSTVPQLARRLIMDRSTLQRNIQPLIKRGMIKVNAGKARRSQVLSLTPLGLKVVGDAVPLWNKAQTLFVRQMGQKKWNLLRENLAAAVGAARGDGALPPN